ncbi:blast:Protein distal antenna [Drosophila guanche]|uniref:Blast:Protein distal antenna n=2 Tax=Drosophila guanche TaxID=7266 RepID=A0A3B0KHQ4_DROGU|nr:blast:Protein distal antenna [Drosophila guanche]
MNIRMGTKGKRPLRSLTPRDKIHAIQRIHDGESKASVARDIGVPESTLRGWCKNEDKLRFMSRQSTTDKMCADALADKLDVSAGLLGPPEKRQRIDPSLPLNFSNKMKFDELGFKRAPLNGLDYSTNKNMSDLNYNGLAVDYVGFNGQHKVFGGDINRPANPSPNAISPLSSLTHLSGLTGLSQSPLAISFNELTTNLNLLAQLNPSLAAMSGLNSFSTTANSLRNSKPSGQPPLQVQSPRSDSGDRTPGLSVKNWAKQKPLSTGPNDVSCSTNLTIKNEAKGADIKSPSPSAAPSHLGGIISLTNLAEDPLLYWLKSQQTMLGLNSLYPPTTPMGMTSPPIRSSTPQHIIQHAQTPPLPSAPLTPSSTPSGSLDEKNAAWYNWCKVFGASLHTLNPNSATLAALQANSLQHQPVSGASDATDMADASKGPFDNILYSHLTKESETPSVRSLSSNEHNQIDQIEADEVTDPDLDTEIEADVPGKPEDLSASAKRITPSQSPTTSLVPEGHTSQPCGKMSTTPSECVSRPESVGGDCKKILDNMLYKIGGIKSHMPMMADAHCESEVSFTNEHNQHSNNNDVSASNNNNNNSNKTDEEEKAKYLDLTADIDNEDVKAIRHGEKFLQWLENCSNPRVTAVQLMQLRFLIAAIKSSNEPQSAEKQNKSLLENEENTEEDSSRNKIRRRK